MPRESRRPDFKIKLKEPTTGRYAEVGAAWNSPEGHISVTLNVGSVLCGTEQARHGMILTLFPVED